VGVVKALLRAFSFLFHIVLALFLLGVSGLALGTNPHALHMGMLPWEGTTLCYVLLFGAIFALISIALALTGRLPLLFFAWSLAVAVLLLKGYFFSSYRFTPGSTSLALEIVAASWLALLGACFALSKRARPRY
jgi:hypothetical protein